MNHMAAAMICSDHNFIYFWHSIAMPIKYNDNILVYTVPHLVNCYSADFKTINMTVEQTEHWAFVIHHILLSWVTIWKLSIGLFIQNANLVPTDKTFSYNNFHKSYPLAEYIHVVSTYYGVLKQHQNDEEQMTERDLIQAETKALAKLGVKRYSNMARAKCGHTSKIRTIDNAQCYGCVIHQMVKLDKTKAGRPFARMML